MAWCCEVVWLAEPSGTLSTHVNFCSGAFRVQGLYVVENGKPETENKTCSSNISCCFRQSEAAETSLGPSWCPSPLLFQNGKPCCLILSDKNSKILMAQDVALASLGKKVSGLFLVGMYPKSLELVYCVQ